MNILAFGLNHSTAPVALRERVVFGRDSVPPALGELIAGGVREAAILSTCNRTEIYCGHGYRAGYDDDGATEAPAILDWLCRHTGIRRAQLADNVYHLPDELAVKHAFRVASGLDSMVLGEPQILGQMKDAHRTAAAAGATGKVLNRLFQHTFSVAKLVRTDTAIGENSVSVAYAGVRLAKRVFSDLAAQTVLLIGAGETIELVARHLVDNGVGAIIIANRSRHRADLLAHAIGGEAITLADIPARLADADIVVTGTASTLPILGKGAVERALASRKNRRRAKPLFVLDLAVPRDVEPEVAALRDVYLYTIDDLKQVVDRNLGLREAAARDAENLIDLQVVRFMRWMRSLDSVPAICALRRQLDALGEAEVERAVRRIRGGEDPEIVARQLARNLTNKFAHRPSRALHDANRDGDGDGDLAAAARQLFGLKK